MADSGSVMAAGGSPDEDLLARLAGAELYSVQFVRDYVQLHFEDAVDSPCLTCYIMPELRRFQLEVAERMTDGCPGYSDALRAFIGAKVHAASAAAGTGLVIEMRTGTIALNPAPEQLVGPEIALLSGFRDRSWNVWRPGEAEFAELT